jgi:hypothetical protein
MVAGKDRSAGLDVGWFDELRLEHDRRPVCPRELREDWLPTGSFGQSEYG